MAIKHLLLVFAMLLLSACSSIGVKSKSKLAKNVKEYKENLPAKISLKSAASLSLEGSCLVNWEKKVNELEKIIRESQDIKKRHQTWLELGHCYAVSGDAKRALYFYEMYEGSLAQNERLDFRYLNNIAEIYEGQKHYAIAKSYYNQIQVGKFKDIAELKMALIESRTGSFEASSKRLNSLLRKYPNDDYLYFLLGVNYFRLQQQENLRNKVINKINEKYTSWPILSNMYDVLKNKRSDYSESFKDVKATLEYQEVFKESL
jgi:tetratricopeptide (TPR) repeat protein